jgi:hypothetical protein
MASKITIKRSLNATPPAGLSFGEMAFVQGSGLTANQIYVGSSAGSPVWVGAQIGTAGTWTDDAAKTTLATQHAIEQRITSKITASATGVASFNGLTGAVTGVSSFNGLTGAVTGITAGGANTFTQLQTFSAGISTAGGTFGTPTQLVGTNITGTALGFTASNVTTNANLTGAITSIGNGTTLGSFSSANLLGALSNKTGTGLNVFDTSPTLVTPNIGAATGTSLVLSAGLSANGGTFGTPTQLVGTNITGTALGFTASNVTTNANLTGAITSIGNGTTLGSFSSANLLGALSDKTGTGVNVFATSPTLTTPVISTITNSGTITLPTLTSTLATLALAETLSNKTLIGVTLGTPISGTLTNCTGLPVASGISGLCGGIATFLATPTSANLATAMSDETGTGLLVFATNPVLTTPNIGAATGTSLVLSAGLSANGGTFGTPTQLVGTNITGTAPGFTVGSASLAINSLSLGGTAASGWAVLASPTFTGTVNTSNLIVGGNLTVSGTTTTINSTTLTIDDLNIIVGATLSGTGALGAEIATGAGIAVGSGTGISFAYNHATTSWLSTVDLNVVSGKSYKIGTTTVLNSSALGNGITGSVLTKVGTITLGTWNGTAITDTYLDTIATPGKVSNAATTATNLGTANAIVARDASGNFTATTITAALSGNATTATTATTATNATNIAITSEPTDTTCFITFVNDSSGNQATKVNAALTYNATSGELSATLIDGGTF